MSLYDKIKTSGTPQTIIFEGLNCTGKSSLMNLVQKGMFSPPYIHGKRSEFMNVERMDATYGYMKALMDLLPVLPMWFDRFHFTEICYGIVRRDYDEYIASKIFAEIDYRLYEMGNVRVVLMIDSPENILKRTEELRGWGNMETIVKLNERMLRASEASMLPVLPVNYMEVTNNRQAMNNLLRFMRGE